MFGSRRRRVVVGLAAPAMATAACSSQGGAQSTGQEARRRPTPSVTFAMVWHAPEGDAFFDVIKKGAQEAADKDNVEFKYSSSGEIPQQSTFIQNAIDSKVDGIAVSLPNPDALAPVIQKAVAAGIPVVAFNAGDRAWQKTGALAFYGEPEVLAGEVAGTKLNKLGAKHALVRPPSPGPGPARGPLRGHQLEVQRHRPTSSTPTAPTPRTYVSTVSAKLTTGPEHRLGRHPRPAARRRHASSSSKKDGSKAKVVTYAFNNDLIPLLQNGEVAFTIDQQPYLQGYLSIDSLWLYKKNQSVIGAQQSIPTGPVVIDQTNIGAILPFVKDGLR